ncbi:MAG: hypothetical protein IT183_03200 [Acidobacteria bacterium]|nr:hypothetical protein [Acidobacteriota bacterium]
MTGTLRAATVVLMVLGAGGGPARAQQAEPAGATRVFPSAADPAGDAGLVIRVSGQTVRGDGGESAGGYSVPADPSFGTHERALSIMPGGCGVSSAPYVVNEAVGGWYIWVTPMTVEGNRVTFRLIWERSPNGNTDAWNPGSEKTLTLAIGQSIPLDVVSAPPQRGAAPDCGSVATVLRVTVATAIPAERDRRLVSTELWLVERRSDGTERTQQQTVRGLFDQPLTFFFDAFDDESKDAAIEFQGRFVATPDAPGVALALTTTSRVVFPDTVLYVLNDGTFFRGREVESALRFTADEVVSVDLPRLADNATGAFQGRTYTLRVRSRQIR